MHDIIRFLKNSQFKNTFSHQNGDQAGAVGLERGWGAGYGRTVLFFLFQILYNAVAVLFL